MINNVNASAEFLRSERLPGLAALAGVLRSWGVRLWLSANYAAPITLTANQPSPITVADPLDARVQQWWQDKIDEIYRLIPDFGGFLVKANSEGQPGPLDYGRTHAEGANMLADRLAAYDGKLVWRSFVHEGFDDWAEYQYRVFHPLDGQFHDERRRTDEERADRLPGPRAGQPAVRRPAANEPDDRTAGHAGVHGALDAPVLPRAGVEVDPRFPDPHGHGSGPTVGDIVTGVAYDQENVGLRRRGQPRRRPGLDRLSARRGQHPRIRAAGVEPEVCPPTRSSPSGSS